MLRSAAATVLLLLAYCSAYAQKLGVELPTTRAQSLSGREVTLPAAVTGHQTVIVIGFSHGSQKAMERWDKEIGAQVSAKPGVPLYNVAVIEDAPKFVRGMITHSMKAMVPTAGQDRFLTVVQGQDQLKKGRRFLTRRRGVRRCS